MAPAIGSRSPPECEVLANGDVVIRLGDVCIQTAARRARSELVNELLDDPKVGSEASIGLLERFLETSDFREMRSRHPELAGGTRCCVQLHQGQDGTVTWEVHGVE
jgi:hypothetical protein